jgi:hypothetical protein
VSPVPHRLDRQLPATGRALRLARGQTRNGVDTLTVPERHVPSGLGGAPEELGWSPAAEAVAVMGTLVIDR